MSVITSVQGVVEVTECDTAEEFLDFLQIRNPRWLNSGATSSTWVFRGQSNADWELRPSALCHNQHWFDEFKNRERQNVENHLKTLLLLSYVQNEYQPSEQALVELILQVIAEVHSKDEFVELANEVGHPIPEDLRYGAGEFSVETWVNDLLDESNQPRRYRFLPTKVEYALAQHHGIPTRLIDWTASPFVGGFFAAEEVVLQTPLNHTHIAVWAINTLFLDHADSHKNTTDIRIISQRKAKIGYLSAQSGLFTYDDKHNLEFLKTGKWRSLEEAIAANPPTTQQLIIRKVILPVQETKQLLRLLKAENISKAHLMPTFDNVTKTIDLMRKCK